MHRVMTGAAALGLVLSGCSGSGSGTGTLSEERREVPAYVLKQEQPVGPPALVIEAGCLDKPRGSVTESATQVRVDYRVRRWDSDGAEPACATRLELPLERPLGTRAVVDDATGQPLEVRG